jgi:tetratricopeptide (TPR) repeat protein
MIFENLQHKLIITMKNLFTAAILISLFCTPLLAQKGKVNSASYSLTSGDVAKAKEQIDEAILDVEAKAMAKSWMVKGDIYKAIYELKPLYEQNPDALNQAKEAYFKAFELETNPKKKKDVKPGLDALYNYFYMEGLQHYQNQKWSQAYRNFRSNLEISEFLFNNGLSTTIDTNAYFVVALTAFNLSQWDEAMRCGEKLMSLGDDREVIYSIMSEVYKQKGEKDKYRKVIAEGRKRYPGSLDLLYKEINLYLEEERLDELEAKLNEALKLDPSNHTIYQALANIYDRKGDKEKALGYYDKAIEMQPDFYEAYFNKGIVYFNMAMDVINKMNDENDEKKYAALKEEREDLLRNKALPLMEKAYSIKSNDASVIKALREIYARLEMFEELQKLPKQ